MTDTTVLIAQIGPVDAVAVVGAARTTSPASIWALPTPIATWITKRLCSATYGQCTPITSCRKLWGKCASFPCTPGMT